MRNGGEFREIIFTLSDLRKGIFRSDDKENNASIFEKARPAILNYPVLVSDLISLEDLSMVNKALEREYATVVRIAMGLDDVIDGSCMSSKIQYIKKFHTNDYNSFERNSSSLLTDDKKLMEEVNLENLKESLDDIIQVESLNEGYCDTLGLRKNNLNDMTLSEARITSTIDGNGRQSSASVEYDNTHNMSGYDKQLLDNDVKKANELIPTTLDITVYQVIGNETVEQHILLGVKCVSHKIKSEEMVDALQYNLKQNRKFFRFIQWTTGEIKFFKDYLLCLDFLKKEALKTKNKDSAANWFRGLRNRANLSKLKENLNLKENLIPNSTIIVTMDEIDYIRNKYNIDLFNDMKSVDKLISNYFLLGFVILDPGSEIAYFKFDGFSKYQPFSYSSLERENRNQGNDIKSLVSLMSGRY